MNKKFFIIIFILFISTYYCGVYLYNLQNSISNKVIRFHVIANSDSAFDQSLKLKVRDKTVEYLTPLLANSKNINESREIINRNINNIQNIATETLAAFSDYTATVELTNSKFPTKNYGDYSFPAGDYEALKITIGEGNGQNWWCVMFPPLCFTDSSIEFTEESVETLRQNLSNEELELISNSNKPKVQIKFKFLEWLNNSSE
ncbi:MAG: stage II sporulation protein R [Clostridiales bacterium]|nr:stage II sporulation protein R [Clostridiales bacterium]